ncbi:hypothetical protein Z945_2072 [Sulfitobacter noctilucae]|nr:hypothetical protein Z945_2072 [Sulfitobacter noctilucae]
MDLIIRRSPLAARLQYGESAPRGKPCALHGINQPPRKMPICLKFGVLRV